MRAHPTVPSAARVRRIAAPVAILAFRVVALIHAAGAALLALVRVLVENTASDMKLRCGVGLEALWRSPRCSPPSPPT